MPVPFDDGRIDDVGTRMPKMRVVIPAMTASLPAMGASL